MADNYLEKKFEELNSPKTKKKYKAGPSLDSLLIKNRSTRGYSQDREVTLEELKKIVNVNIRIASSKNQQALRFKLVVAGPEADFVNENIKMGALFRARRAAFAHKSADSACKSADCTDESATPALSEVDCPSLPLPGTEPQAFIVVYGTHQEDPSMLIDLGISLQSMSLKAVELGLNCLMIRAFNREAMSRLVAKGATGDATVTTGAATANMTDTVSDTKEELFPLAVLAVGKSAESIFLIPGEKSSLDYFRKEGIHYVPKLSLEEILI